MPPKTTRRNLPTPAPMPDPPQMPQRGPAPTPAATPTKAAPKPTPQPTIPRADGSGAGARQAGWSAYSHRGPTGGWGPPAGAPRQVPDGGELGSAGVALHDLPAAQPGGSEARPESVDPFALLRRSVDEDAARAKRHAAHERAMAAEELSRSRSRREE